MRLFRFTASATTTTLLTTTTTTLLFRSLTTTTTTTAFRYLPTTSTTTTAYYNSKHRMTNQQQSISSTKTARPVARTALEESGQDGAFVRKDAAYRNWIREGMYNGGKCCVVLICVSYDMICHVICVL